MIETRLLQRNQVLDKLQLGYDIYIKIRNKKKIILAGGRGVDEVLKVERGGESGADTRVLFGWLLEVDSRDKTATLFLNC